MNMGEPPSPTPRRVATPKWLDLRLVLGIVLVLAAVGLGAKVIGDARHTDAAYAVTHDLAAGTTLRAEDLTEVDAQLPDTASLYVTDRSKAVGKVLSRPLNKGELVPTAVLDPAGSQATRTRVTVPFSADSAPRLSRGQRIVVWLSAPACPSLVLLPDVTVQDVHAADAGTFGGGSGQDVDLTVTPELAQRVADALGIDHMTLRAGVLTGAPKAQSALPTLDSCAATASGTP